MLELQFRGRHHQRVKLTPPAVTIGRDPKNHFVVDAASVADFHAEIIVDGQQIFIADLLNNSGTYVNEKRISGLHKLQTWDLIRVGSAELEINDPDKKRSDEWALCADCECAGFELLAGQRFTLLPKATIGRDPGCDISITSAHLSRRHAETYIENSQLRVVDLCSRNGTFLNGIRIVNEAFAKPGDQLRFDEFTFIVAGPIVEGLTAANTQQKNIDHDLTRLRIGMDDETKVHQNLEATRMIEIVPGTDIDADAERTIIFTESKNSDADHLKPHLKKGGVTFANTRVSNSKFSKTKLPSWVFGALLFLLFVSAALLIYCRRSGIF